MKWILCFLVVVLLGFAAETLEAQTIVAVDIAKGRLQWNWTGVSTPLEFRVSCGLTSGSSSIVTPLPFVVDPTNTYFMPVSQAVRNKPGTYFCVVTAANAIGESAPSNEISFFAGTVPEVPSGLAVVAQ